MSDWTDDGVVSISSSRGCVNVTTLYPKKGTALKDFPTPWFWTSVLCSMLMCFNGGFINGICFAGPWHAGLTHVTGSVTLSGTRVAVAAKPGQYTYWEYLSFVFSFGVGAVFAGFVIGNTWVRWGRLQASMLILQGLLIILAIYLSKNFEIYLSGIVISFAMGVQNSISSTYAPMTLRTSHVSGTVLDIGLTIGQMIRHRNLEGLWKLKVHAPTLASYWIGAVCGCFTFTSLAENALYINAGATIFVGLLTFVLFRTPLCFFEDPTVNLVSIEMKEKLTGTENQPQKGYGSMLGDLIPLDVIEKKY